MGQTRSTNPVKAKIPHHHHLHHLHHSNHRPSTVPHHYISMKSKMWNPCLLLALLHLYSSPKASAFLDFGVGVGVGVGGAGFRISTAQIPPPTNPNLMSNNEYTALQAWKSAITEDPNGVLTSWVGPNVCSYKGVFCAVPPIDDDDAHQSLSPVIRGIDLNRANLKGSLVDSLSLISHLSILHLNSNRLSGTVPDSFGDLRSLTELDLSNNLLSGPFPASTLLIPNLLYLDLRFNQLSGEIPDELFEKDVLDAIFLNNNRFSGQIPMNLWASPASVITLANNQLSGSIPMAWGSPAGIREVLLLNNKLTGCVPEGVGYLPGIEVLDLSYNSLAGHLPGSLQCLSAVEVLNVAHNRLSGDLPDLCGLRSLENLTVAYNFFSGFGDDCGVGGNGLSWFDFTRNCIPGTGMQRPPPECMGMPGGGLSCLRIPTVRPAACSQFPVRFP